jgi:hypothetical protein
MSLDWQKAGYAFRDAAMLALGIVLAAVPLALWIAWTETMFFAICGVFIVALVAYIALAHLDGTSGPIRPLHFPSPRITPEFIDEMQRLMPLIYHHSPIGSYRFHQTMARLRAILQQQGNGTDAQHDRREK